MVTIYNAVSADGFIARKDGSEDFIPDDAWGDFLDVLRKHDAVVVGRKTYETLQTYPKAMIEEFEAVDIKRVVVSQDTNFHPKDGYSVISAIPEIPACGTSVLITSGPTLNTAAFRAGIIDRVVLNIIPKTIGEGIPVFNKTPELLLLSTEERPAGRKMHSYKFLS